MEWLIQEKGNRSWKALMGPQTQWIGATVDLQVAAKGFTVAVKSHLHSLVRQQPGGVFSLAQHRSQAHVTAVAGRLCPLQIPRWEAGVKICLPIKTAFSGGEVIPVR